MGASKAARALVVRSEQMIIVWTGRPTSLDAVHERSTGGAG